MYIVDSFKKCSKEFKQKLLDIDPTTDPVLLFAKQGRTPGTFSVALSGVIYIKKVSKSGIGAPWPPVTVNCLTLTRPNSQVKNYKPKVK